MKKTYKVGAIWESWGLVEVQAESEEEVRALMADQDFLDSLPLPEGEYVDGSFAFDEEGILEEI